MSILYDSAADTEIQVVNVKNFGALGNGATDDSIAIQNAINSVQDMAFISGLQNTSRPIYGASIYFPPGVYPIFTTLTVPDTKNITFFGDSMASTVLRSSGGSPPNYIFTLPNTGNTQHVLKFQGLGLHKGGISIGNGYRRFGMIEECQFVGAPVWAITFGTQCVEWVIQKCAISEGGGGIHTEGSTNTDLITMRHVQFIRNSGIDADIDVATFLLDNCDFEIKTSGSEGFPYIQLGTNIVHGEFRSCRLGSEVPAPTVMVRAGSGVGSPVIGNIAWTNCFFTGGITCFQLNHPVRRWTIRDGVMGVYTTLFDEVFATSLTNSTNAVYNYADFIMTDGDLSTVIFNVGGVGWTLSPRLRERIGGASVDYPQQNLLFRTNQLDTGANWSRTNTTPVKDVIGPDGTLSGFTVAATSTANASVSQPSTTVTTPVTFSVWLKAGTISKARISIRQASGGTSETGGQYNCKLTSEWKRFSVTSYFTGSRSTGPVIELGAVDDTVTAGDSILMAFPQLNNGLIASPFIENPSASAILHADPKFQSLVNGLHIIGWSGVSPTANFYAVGDIVLNTVPSGGGTIGWVCTASGSPGTWKAWGDIAP